MTETTTELTTVEITRKILDVLANNSVLAEYVKSFTIGGIESSRKLFPFITIEAPSRETTPLSMGPNGYMNNIYTFRIFGGTYHTLPSIAYIGNDKGKKGIIQLNSDILNAVIPNNFDNMFERPATLLSSTTAHKVSSGGRSWIAMVTMTGRLRTKK